MTADSSLLTAAVSTSLLTVDVTSASEARTFRNAEYPLPRPCDCVEGSCIVEHGRVSVWLITYRLQHGLQLIMRV